MEVLWHTAEAERLIGIAMRRCYTSKPLQEIMEEVSAEYGAYLTCSAYQRMEFDVYEHVRISGLMTASPEELLSLLLRFRYLDVTRLDRETWLVSFNLRTALEAMLAGVNGFSEVVQSVAPNLHKAVGGHPLPPRPAGLETKQRAGTEAGVQMKVEVIQALTPHILNDALRSHGYRQIDSKQELAKHCFVTLSIEGISRVCSHQLVRHRPVSFSQESQRFSAAVEEDFVVPDSIAANTTAREVALTLFAHARQCYAKLRELGIKKEDARFVLPMAISTKLMMTVQSRYLNHILFYRSSASSVGLKAQWEIRRLSDKILTLVSELMPDLFSELTP
ncbi:MAG: thymidylate synthase (FAD) [Nitrososphaerota archaeon]